MLLFISALHFYPGFSFLVKLASVMSVSGAKFSSISKLGGNLCKALAIAGLVLYIIYIFFSNYPSGPSSFLFLSNFLLKQGRYYSCTKTEISDIVFGIATSAKTWKHKKPYIDEWWIPNVTRGFIWFERHPKEYLPWPSHSPPYRISESTERFKEYNKHGMPHAIRMVRIILETFREDHNGVKWYVMADDDTVLLLDNLVEVLSKYDHNEYLYIGDNSECIGSNFDNSFQMAFGGAGYALSFPLARALARHLDECIRRYPTLYGSDHVLQSCIADLGVLLTHEKGFHQIDLHGDLSGFLSAHPQAPFISLHHLDHTNPIFPSMNRHDALKHLMKAAKTDSSRVLQQTICYHKPENWSFSISWGYSAQIYEKIHPPSMLERPLQTFSPWRTYSKYLHYMFNTRPVSKDPCQAPHLFFFDSVEEGGGGTGIVTNYIRRSPRNLPTCVLGGNHSADPIQKIRVLSPRTRLNEGGRRECCDVARIAGQNVTEVRIRKCMIDEIV